jgi:hypothetical protein
MPKRVAESAIGEVLLDAVQQMVQVRLYNMTLDLEISEWRDLVSMVAEASEKIPDSLEAAPMEGGGDLGELLGHSFQTLTCPACSEDFAAFTGGGEVACPSCGAPVPAAGKQGNGHG